MRRSALLKPPGVPEGRVRTVPESHGGETMGETPVSPKNRNGDCVPDLEQCQPPLHAWYLHMISRPASLQTRAAGQGNSAYASTVAALGAHALLALAVKNRGGGAILSV